MVKVSIAGVVVAESSNTVEVEGNHYFPPDDVKLSEYFSDSQTSTAAYYDVTVNGVKLPDAAWTYPEPKEKAENIAKYVAFYKNKVKIE